MWSVHSFAAALGAAATRDLGLFKRELVIVRKFFSRDDPNREREACHAQWVWHSWHYMALALESRKAIAMVTVHSLRPW